ncbi:MAG: agmatinase [Bdellovibrionales bacterium RIFCSPHIGHO2_01_FULL_40_29]|nr:MAG: agmatinase [Bdellovibrionales bacterium RIFCSPHIGHO2_01_FULL_40_29]OFZ35379.1 MAG: agmatinase [Bdellovibrionales bacterium RIFCSPHIGHO2_02_FULL_40_15]
MSKDFKPMSGREFPRFSAIKTFFRLPIAEMTENFDVAIFGVPYDGGVSYRPGARFAPTQIRDASSLGRGFHMTRAMSLFENLKVADIGDCPTVPIDQAQTYEKIEKFATSVLNTKKKFIAVGGDHSTTLPLLRAVRKHVGQPLQFIHFDAHLDTYPAAWGCEYHHGSFARHAIEEGLVDPKNMLQIGIRGPLAGSDDLKLVTKHHVQVRTMDDIREKPIQEFIKTLPEFNGSTYLSFDIDCLDPAYAPGTGTPVPGGMTTYEVQRILRALKIKNLVAADIVEVSPPFDTSQITSLAAVDTLFELLCLMGEKKD